MKTTVLVFHPQLANGSRVNHTFAAAAKEVGYDVRDMYALYPDFHIDVKAEKAVLTDTDRIVLQFPIYWYQTPALLKQWFDDVLEYGWAYGSNGTALQGKEVLLVPTFGADAAAYTVDGRYETTVDEVLKPIKTIQYLTGLRFLEPVVTYGTLGISEADLAAKTSELLARLEA